LLINEFSIAPLTYLILAWPAEGATWKSATITCSASVFKTRLGLCVTTIIWRRFFAWRK